ncbi:MAG: threonylcarbamoyl-AMP synthase [Clostridia bacterium]|nr:threonylcarbamoyl-AMP synthase [Clostridia bacterium]MBR0406568.1 threonylcarbamoyl-AMP synthase [Clostridia bacterium]
METLCLPAGKESLQKAAELFRAGQVVAFPTETVYGLGADALNEEAVRAIFAAKERPADNPLIVHVARRNQLEGLCRVTDTAEQLMDAFWPGPLTLLLMKTSRVPDVTTAGLPSVAVRCPSHPVAHELLEVCGLPIAAPSANRSGRPSPTTARDVYEDMAGRIPLILDGGSCDVGVESTVLDLTGDVPCVLRPGAITAEDVASIVGQCTVAPSVMRPLKEGESAPSPGMKHRHYAPKAKMTVFIGTDEAVAAAIIARYDQAENAAILAHDSALPLFGSRRAFSLGSTPREGAHLLFRRLREMDALDVSLIFAQGWKAEGEALAVMNRMARAAAFDLVQL